jgi:probable HAF family extracellular repeat protein
LAILLFLPLMAHAQSELLHAFLWTQADGMQDLGTIPGWQNSIAYAISDSGEVVGYDSNTAGNVTAFRWTVKAGMQHLPGASMTWSVAVAVNNSGDVAGGYYPTGTTTGRGFIWTQAAGFQDIGTLGGSTTGVGGMNRSAEIVGSSETSSGADHGFLWTQGGGMQDLGTFFPCAINDAGLMAGTTYAANGDPEAAVWNNGKVSILGPGGACGINNRGQVVGTRYTPHSSTEQAFIWTPGGAGMQLLPQLPGAVATIGEAINDSGEVVGWNFPPPGGNAYQAFIWTPTGGTQDIGNLGGNYGAQAFAINDAGQVVGSSTIQ